MKKQKIQCGPFQITEKLELYEASWHENNIIKTITFW